jgi:peptide/nickel transport system permease protein
MGDPNQMSWGQILMIARKNLGSSPWIAIFPGLALVILVWAFFSVGDGINYALNPRLRER